MRNTFTALWLVGVLLIPFASLGQDDYDDDFGDEEESSFKLNGYFQLQSGVFVPLGLDGMYDSGRAFQDHKMKAYGMLGDNIDYNTPCDPAVVPTVACSPQDHGGRAGDPSMFRGTIQLEADWAPLDFVNLHAVVRGVRALSLDQDYWAQPPEYYGVEDRQQWVVDNIYNELDLREFYLDIYPADWLSFRIGRQQVTWGETGQYRLLDVVNPADNTWHFGPLESFQDTRVPLWIVKALIEFHDIEHSLELLWVPGIDRPEDSVTVPLSFVGAWGLPPTNTASPFRILDKEFLYPSQNGLDSMRGGFRWKGNLGSRTTYSLVYYYTHQMSPPVPTHYDRAPILDPSGAPTGQFDSDVLEKLYLAYPRQHIAGFSLGYTFDNPIGMVAKLEAAVEPDRTFPRTSSTPHSTIDMSYVNRDQRFNFNPVQKPVVSYAVTLMRPTMIRALNPTQNFLFLVQWMHTIIPNISEEEGMDLIEIPGFNEYTIQTHSWKVIAVAATSYMHGLLSPKVIFAYVHPHSGFITASLGIRVYDNWRIQFTATDFFGEDPYKAVGLFRDRDEVNLRVRFQF